MASILEFRRPAFQFRPLMVSGTTGPADVVLFPGVRYERWSEETAPPAKAQSSRSARRRDRLDFDD